ncbi:ectonucleotide pyrophosphatase/phosphodiesterase family member 7 [Engraulis encrasicolus]|uniref:ectonucleotide pyrophosphatase/phosphodiesterase family member 7 n=1 Tax=Engraulis encrasicolus TaxID=184585 RepID=UPI002FD27DC3
MRLAFALVLCALLYVECRHLGDKSKKGFNKLLLISFDGFRWDYDQDVDTPNFDQLVVDGVKAKYISPPMITMTSPSHFTTITGRWIEDHGVVHNMLFNSTTLLKITHKKTMKRSEWWDNGALPLWITAQNQGLKTASFYYPGGGVNYSGQAVNRALTESYGMPDDNETEWQQNIDKVMDWYTKEDFDFVTLYFGEPDNVGHNKGPETPERKKIIEMIDRILKYLRDAIVRNKLTDSLNVIITSDHGMTTIQKNKFHGVEEIVLSNYINFLKSVHFELLDYGGFAMIRPREGQKEILYNQLKDAHPNLTVYRKEDVPENFHIAKNSRIQDLILVGDLGYNLNSRAVIYVNKGDHGFHNDEMDMKMIFRAFGPDFKKGYLAEPFDSVNIYALMCKLMGVVPAPHNGSLAHTEGMLVDNFDDLHPVPTPVPPPVPTTAPGGHGERNQMSFLLLAVLMFIASCFT